MPQTSFPHSLEQTGGSYASISVKKSELLTVGILLALFLTVCICIQGRYVPWGDEVQFTDPAVNLYDKLGFVSREWSNQNDQTFWASNAPAYSMLLYIAFRVFHFSQAVARSMNALIMCLAALFLWIAVLRARFLSRPNMRLLMLAFVLGGYGCYYCYSNIRYDGLCLLECSLAFLAYTLARPSIRNLCLLVIGAAMILTNLQLPQYAVALILILTYAYLLGFTLVWRLRFLYLGFVVGGASLFLLYASHPGSLHAFLVTLRQQAGQSIGDKLHDLPYYLEYDASLAVLLLFLLASLAMVRIFPHFRARQSVVAGVLICTVIPAFFFLARRYVFSSAWMVYVPAAVCVCCVWEANLHASRAWKTLAAICCAASIGFGLPKALVGLWNDWAVRDYAVVESFVAASVGAKDIVFCEPSAYFAARSRAARVYGPGYLEVMSAAEKKVITVIIVPPDNEAAVTRDLGGKWIAIRQLVRDSKSSTGKPLPFSTNFSCRLNVLRRL